MQQQKQKTRQNFAHFSGLSFVKVEVPKIAHTRRVSLKLQIIFTRFLFFPSFGFNGGEPARVRNFIKRRGWWDKSQIREDFDWEIDKGTTDPCITCIRQVASQNQFNSNALQCRFYCRTHQVNISTKLLCKNIDHTKASICLSNLSVRVMTKRNNILTSRLINIKTTPFFRRQHLKSTEIVISTSISISTNKKTATTWSTSSTAEGIVSQPLSSYLRRKKQQYQTHGEWVSEWPGKPTIGPGFDEKAKLEKRCPLIGTSHGLKDDVRMSDNIFFTF